MPVLRSIFVSLLLVTSTLADETTPATESTRTLPKVIVFDVNETLLDLQNMRASVGQALGGRDDLLPLWFSTMLHYSLVATVTQEYHDFGEIGVTALLMVAEGNQIELHPDDAKQAIVSSLLSLPPHSDVEPGLMALSQMDVRIVSLTNSSNYGVQTQFENAGLTDFFSARYSIEDIGVYKPDLRSYEWLLENLGVAPEEALMVAAHGWDVAGAKAAGMQTAFITRPGKVLYPLATEPDYVVNDLLELVAALRTANNTLSH